MDAEAQLEGFIAKYSDEVADQMRAARAKIRKRLPGAVELVYDNYNALAIAYGPNEKLADVVSSITAYPRWVSLFFSHGADLEDPGGLLQGEGSRIRHVVLDTPERLEHREIRALMDQALARASVAMTAATNGRTVIKSVSTKQRSRRPT